MARESRRAFERWLANVLVMRNNRHLIFAGSAMALITGLGTVLPLAGCNEKQPAAPVAMTTPQATAPAVQAAPQPAPAPAPNPEQDARQHKLQQLIAKVEQTFKNGEAHYRKGELVKAKVDFDSAVDQMLSSGIDIQSDPTLEDEFNRILDAVNALETEALKQGNGFAPAVEPAPADVANDVTFEVDPSLVAKAKEELVTTKSDLPLVINDYVAGYINFFANSQRGHNTLKHSLERGGKYKAMIQKVMQEEGVPQDLIYLAVAESGFQPHAVNGHSGAGGMWQFMPHGDYGLVRNGYVDERFDPEKSTRAYAKYMKFLYNQLGDWYLAMAAYDWGAGNVQRAVQKTGYADYWELYKRNNLPGETKNYVPEILAAIIITKNPTQYGFDDVQLDAPIVTDTVMVNYAVDIRLAADIVGAQVQDLLALNPGLLRMSTPPADTLAEPFALHLPAGTAALYEQRIAAIPEEKRTQWRYHRVTPDDTLDTVARSYHVSVNQLAAVNQLQEGDSLAKVEALVIPVPLPPAPVRHTEIYRARRGETLITIADRFGVSLDDLHRWNHIGGTSVQAGQRVRVTEPAHVSSSALRRDRETSATSASKGAASGSSRKGASGAGKTKSAATGKESAHSTAGKRSHAQASSHAATAKKQGASKTASSAQSGVQAKRSNKDQKSTSKKNIEK
jgi:membrane-bound lytic murein transglycosylase D